MASVESVKFLKQKQDDFRALPVLCAVLPAIVIVVIVKNSLRTDDPDFSSGFLPLNCLSVWQGKDSRRFVLWHPRLYADMALYDTPYPHFPNRCILLGMLSRKAGRLTALWSFL